MSFVNELDDLCDFTKISSRWKQAKTEKQPSPSPTKTEISNPSSNYNPSNKENTLPINTSIDDSKKQTTKVRSHAPQIIDEDTEQFKIRLEHLLNVFKTEATSEFMLMKRSMLEDQKLSIKQDTEKYLQMYELKSAELIQAKEQLNEQLSYCNQTVNKNEKISAYCGKLKISQRNKKTMALVLKAMKSFKQYQKTKRINKKKALHHYQKTLMRFAYSYWCKQFNLGIREKIKEQMKVQQQQDLDIIVAKFRKEQSLLENQLHEATTQLDEANRVKIGMQENLKRAFMRGVCALNFEAMNVLNGNGQNIELESLASNILANNPSVGNNLNDTINLNESKDQWQRQQSPPKNIAIHQPMRMETNDHRWKDAPLVGTKQLSEITENQSINLSIAKLVQQDDMQFDNDEECNEGKVIKVNFDVQQPQQQQQQLPKKTTQSKQPLTKAVPKTQQQTIKKK